MIAVGIAMLRPRAAEGDPSVRITPAIAAASSMIGLIVGAFSGFFGIGGSFLIVPGIMLGSGMPILNAIGSSLLSVGTFGLTTAVNYALSAWSTGRSRRCSSPADWSADFSACAPRCIWQPAGACLLLSSPR